MARARFAVRRPPTAGVRVSTPPAEASTPGIEVQRVRLRGRRTHSAALRAARTGSTSPRASSPFRLRSLRSSVCESVDSVILLPPLGFLPAPIDTGFSSPTM